MARVESIGQGRTSGPARVTERHKLPPVKAPAASGNIVEQLFEQAYIVNEDQEKVNERRNGVRNSLRSLRAAGVLSDEQAAEVEELYPTVERKRKPKGEGDDSADAS